MSKNIFVKKRKVQLLINIYYFILYIQVKTHNEMGYIFITRKILLILIYIHYLFFICSVHVIEESPSNDHNV